MSIVVAYSPDVYGRAALEHGARLAQADDEQLVLVNATRGESLVDRRYAHEDEVAELVGRWQAAGVRIDVRRDLVADVAEAVLDAAEETGARLVVVGVRRRSPVGKALLGSVAQRLILDAECPVLAVKPER
ncbi:universal stress protein [Marmoricola endophyticus]|uniref:Universal stress protein n=1 Tax=Marmoricola endophyticus TaxID=2040280 RepID=A0A917BUR0_9ACTN|nr:universal stress protein [Marmoricola endophyticus]GGF57441.1 universal stress protein [Marmoricola endophyticus]